MNDGAVQKFEELPIEEKEKIISSRKKTFKRITIIVGVLFLFVTVSIVVLTRYINETISHRVTYVQNETPQATISDVPQIQTLTYSSIPLQVNFSYQSDAKLSETVDTEKGEGKVEVTYSKGEDPNFIEGYKFTVTVFSTLVRGINEVAQTKMQSLYTTCPEIAQGAQIQETTVGDQGALYFSIDGCNGYYRVYYVTYGGKFYEISRYYKGDIGFRQQYDIHTNEILNSIKFTPKIFDDVDTELLKQVSDDQTKINFKYPSNLSVECQIETPTDSGYRTILSVCDGNSGISFVYLTQESKSGDTAVMLDLEKKKLTDDYFAAKGKPANGEVKDVIVGNKPGYQYINYSWRGDVYTFVPLISNKSKILTIIYRPGTNTTFKDVSEKIINSITFGD